MRNRFPGSPQNTDDLTDPFNLFGCSCLSVYVHSSFFQLIVWVATAAQVRFPGPIAMPKWTKWLVRVDPRIASKVSWPVLLITRRRLSSTRGVAPKERNVRSPKITLHLAQLRRFSGLSLLPAIAVMETTVILDCRRKSASWYLEHAWVCFCAFSLTCTDVNYSTVELWAASNSVYSSGKT